MQGAFVDPSPLLPPRGVDLPTPLSVESRGSSRVQQGPGACRRTKVSRQNLGIGRVPDVKQHGARWSALVCQTCECAGGYLTLPLAYHPHGLNLFLEG